MALHRAEQILAQVATLLTGLTTTGANVTRARIYPHADTALPALSILQGEDNPRRDDEAGALMAFIDHELEVVIDAHVQAASGVLDTTLNLIRKEISIALHADRQIGLPTIVINTIEGGAEAPELSGEGAQRTARQRLHYFIKYRRSRTDPSA